MRNIEKKIDGTYNLNISGSPTVHCGLSVSLMILVFFFFVPTTHTTRLYISKCIQVIISIHTVWV